MIVRADVSVTTIRGRARGATRRGVLVTLSAEGRSGVGEASPLPGRSRESIDDVLAAITRLGPQLSIDLSKNDLDLVVPPSLELALDTARHELLRALTGHTREPRAIETQMLGDDVGSIERELAAFAAGARSFKLKIRSREDCARVVALRRAAPDARLRVDANRAFDSFAEVPWDLLVEARVEWIEEPMRALPLLSPVPIALDETVEEDPLRAKETIAGGSIAAVVLKPTLLGPRLLREIATHARAHGVRTVVSHAFESEVGRAAALELANEIDPTECHGLARWSGLESFRPESVDEAAPLV